VSPGDIEADQITVRRTYWRKHEGPPKTHARSASVPLLPKVRDALEEHHRQNPGTTFVFEGPLQIPVDLRPWARVDQIKARKR